MAVSGIEPVSVQDLGIAFNGSAADEGIGNLPVSVDDLKMALDGLGASALYGGTPVRRAELAKSFATFDFVYIQLMKSGVCSVFAVTTPAVLFSGNRVVMNRQEADGTFSLHTSQSQYAFTADAAGRWIQSPTDTDLIKFVIGVKL